MEPHPRVRVRELIPSLYLGRFKTGQSNSLTDVSGVLVHAQSIVQKPDSSHKAVNTGVTTILPRKDFFHNACYAGIFSLNGSGEMTGSHWINETGLLHVPIIITNTFATGAGIQGVLEYCAREYKNDKGLCDWFVIPVVTETFDGILSDIGAFSVKPHHIIEGIEKASSQPVPEGNTGGGTGMIVFSTIKGGTGSSSRIVPGRKIVDGNQVELNYTIAALVQANFGHKKDFRMGGAPVGRFLIREEAADAAGKESQEGDAKETEERTHESAPKEGSIIVILATDAPLHPVQLQRIAKRASLGLGRVGGMAQNSSGDIFLAFSTANSLPVGLRGNYDPWTATELTTTVTDDWSINGLFEAATDVVEESIYNAMCMAETTEGPDGLIIQALDLAKTKTFVEKYTALF